MGPNSTGLHAQSNFNIPTNFTIEKNPSNNTFKGLDGYDDYDQFIKQQ